MGKHLFFKKKLAYAICMRKKQPSKHKGFEIDLFVITGIIIFAAISTLAFHLTYYQSSLLYFLLPSIFLFVRKTKSLKKILITSFGGTFLGISYDLYATVNKAWIIPANQLITPWKLFGLVPADDVIWFCCWVLFITTFYEHFLDHDRTNKLSHHFTWAVGISLVTLVISCSLYYLSPSFLLTPYAYLLLILTNIPLLVFFTFQHTSLFKKFLKISIYFIPVFVLFELTGLANNQWVFTGEYIGLFHLYNLILPYEEIIFFILLSPTIVLSYYECFIDDGR